MSNKKNDNTPTQLNISGHKFIPPSVKADDYRQNMMNTDSYEPVFKFVWCL